MVRRGRGYECSRGLLVPRQRLVRVPCQFYFMPDTNYSYHFNEAEWIKLLFTLADTQEWINRMNKDLFRQIPVSKKGLISNDYYLSVTAVAHSPELSRTAWDSFGRRMAAWCSSTRSGNCLWRYRPNSCASCRPGACSASAKTRKPRSMFASSPPHIATSGRWSWTGRFARTCSIA